MEAYNPLKTRTIVSPLRANTGDRVTEFPLRNTKTNYDTYTSFKSLSIADTANFKRGTYGASLPLTEYYLNKNKEGDDEFKEDNVINSSSYKNPYAEQVSI